MVTLKDSRAKEVLKGQVFCTCLSSHSGIVHQHYLAYKVDMRASDRRKT